MIYNKQKKIVYLHNKFLDILTIHNLLDKEKDFFYKNTNYVLLELLSKMNLCRVKKLNSSEQTQENDENKQNLLNFLNLILSFDNFYSGLVEKLKCIKGIDSYTLIGDKEYKLKTDDGRNFHNLFFSFRS
jgi:hypothetical protein